MTIELPRMRYFITRMCGESALQFAQRRQKELEEIRERFPGGGLEQTIRSGKSYFLRGVEIAYIADK